MHSEKGLVSLKTGRRPGAGAAVAPGVGVGARKEASRGDVSGVPGSDM